MNMEMSHEPAAERFVAVTEGQKSVLDYELSGKTMTITHTGVPASLRGRGIAGELTAFALEEARAQGWKVIPLCSYAAHFFSTHREYADLLVQKASD